jgi:hypothetical protein
MMTTGASHLKRGDTFDPECGRTTHRLRLGQHILAAAGIESAHVHGEHRENFRGCYSGCRNVWPEWVTDEMFESAWSLADKVQTERGRHARRETEGSNA